MSELPDDLLRTPPPERSPRRPSPVVPVIAGAVLVAAVAALVWFLWSRRAAEEPFVPPAPTPTSVTEPEPAPPALGVEAAGEAEPLEIPPLEESDDIVRQLVRSLSSHEELARWLGAEELVRRFVVSVVNVAEGVHPRKHLPLQGPPGRFAVVEGEGGSYVAPEAYGRYDRWVDLFVRLEPPAVARVYGQLRPLFQEAYRDLGYPDGDFDRATEKAIRRLLAVPVPSSPPRLQPKVRSWAFADPALESLSPAEKQLLRLGSHNQRAVQAQLRAIAEALGMEG